MDISKCETCKEDCPQAQSRHEAATGRMYAMRELAKCAPYWDALFDENEKPKITPDRLRKLVEADREGRCVVLPCNPGDVVWLITERGTRCVERWIVHRVYKRDTGDWCFDLKNMMLSLKRPNEFEMCKRSISSFGKTVFLTREAAEAPRGIRQGRQPKRPGSRRRPGAHGPGLSRPYLWEAAAYSVCREIPRTQEDQIREVMD